MEKSFITDILNGQIFEYNIDKTELLLEAESNLSDIDYLKLLRKQIKKTMINMTYNALKETDDYKKYIKKVNPFRVEEEIKQSIEVFIDHYGLINTDMTRVCVDIKERLNRMLLLCKN